MVGVCVAWRLLYGTLPRRLIIMSGLVVAPWCLFAWAWFGSPVPHSLIAKLQAGQHTQTDPWWIARLFVQDARAWVIVAAAVGLLAIRSTSARAGVLALWVWVLLHSLAYSLVSLGDTFPWYLGVPLSVTLVLASSVFAWGWRWPVVAGLGVVLAMVPHVQETRYRLRVAGQPTVADTFEADRRQAGRFLEQPRGRRKTSPVASGGSPSRATAPSWTPQG